MIEIISFETHLLDEIADKHKRQKDVAWMYAWAIQSPDKPSWSVVNKAIIERWSVSGLERIKKMAWSALCKE